MFGGVILKRYKNYDSPFEEEKLHELDHKVILENEYIISDDVYGDYDDDYLPDGVNSIIRTDAFYPFGSSFSATNGEQAYEIYKDIEGLKD